VGLSLRALPLPAAGHLAEPLCLSFTGCGYCRRGDRHRLEAFWGMKSRIDMSRPRKDGSSPSLVVAPGRFLVSGDGQSGKGSLPRLRQERRDLSQRHETSHPSFRIPPGEMFNGSGSNRRSLLGIHDISELGATNNGNDSVLAQAVAASIRLALALFRSSLRTRRSSRFPHHLPSPAL